MTQTQCFNPKLCLSSVLDIKKKKKQNDCRIDWPSATTTLSYSAGLRQKYAAWAALYLSALTVEDKKFAH